MRYLHSISLLFVVVALGTNCEKFSFDGYNLIRLFPTLDNQLDLIEQFERNDPSFDVWSSNNGPVKTVDVLLSQSALVRYRPLFNINDIKFVILDDNIQDKIDNQLKSMQKPKDDSILLRYARYSQIISFVDDKVADNPDLATSYIAGRSHENRLLKVIVLKPVATSTRSLWIDCGIHAREWVSPATCVYIIDTLIKEYRANDPVTTAIFNKYEIHILPLVNPDGYEYTFNTYRLWRKNRRVNTGSSCAGVDLNRNFGYKWLTGGSSTSACSEVFAGPSANSEPETQAIQNALRNKTGNWDAYFNLHSYGDWWLLPYGYSYTEKPDDYAELMSQGQIGVDAIKAVNGEQFTIGTSSDLLYINSGSSKDWAKGELNVKYSFVLELRPGYGTPDYSYGFTLPEDRMRFVAPETYAGIKAFFNSLI